MIIAKVYDSPEKVSWWMDYYVRFNSGSVDKVTHKDKIVHLVTRDKILFRSVQNLDDVLRQFSGVCVQWLELDSGSIFNYEIEQWLKTRVRVPTTFIKEVIGE